MLTHFKDVGVFRVEEKEAAGERLMLRRLTRTAFEPTWDGLAELQRRDLQSQKERGSSEEGCFALAAGSTDGEPETRRRGQSRLSAASSHHLTDSMCLFLCVCVCV